VLQFGKELRIAAELETLYPMRLQAMRLQAMRPPDAINGRRTHALGTGQRAHAPMRRSRRLRIQGGVHDGFFFLSRQSSLASGAGRILEQSLQPSLLQAAPPTQHGGATGAKFPRHTVVGYSVGRAQHNAEAKYDLLRCTSRPCKTFQQLSLFLAETQTLGSFPHAVHYTAYLVNCNVTYETLH